MKKSVIVAIILTLFIIGHYLYSKKLYQNKTVLMSGFKLPQFAEDALNRFYNDSNYYPENLNLRYFYDTTDLNNGEIHALNQKMLIDPYSKNMSSLHYIKLKKDDVICGFILLSAGIDGYINNNIYELECSDFNNSELELYSSEEFNYRGSLFGNRDLIYHYENKCNCNYSKIDSAYIIPLRWMEDDEE